MPNSNGKLFPRDLTQKEKEILFSILPIEKPGYKKYREKIEKLKIIGIGRFGGGNMILGNANTKPDLLVSSMPVFALGSVECENSNLDVIIHEELEDEIEFDISANIELTNFESVKIKSSWSYSTWNPGEKSPNDSSFVREVVVIPKKYLLAIVPKHQKLWLHDTETGINHLIPISNFYNHLMLTKNIRDSKIALKPSSFFIEHEKYSDKDLASAFLYYNKYMKRVEIDYSEFHHKVTNKKKRKLLNFFSRG